MVRINPAKSQGGGGGAALPLNVDVLTVGVDGQTVFTLADTPNDITAVQLFVNGQKLNYGTHFGIVGTTLTMTLSTFELQTTDNFIAYYQ